MYNIKIDQSFIKSNTNLGEIIYPTQIYQTQNTKQPKTYLYLALQTLKLKVNINKL